MSGKKGMVHNRPASTPARAILTGDIADPANGEKVARCAICGLPDQPGNRLIPGLWAYIRFHMDLGLCERCVMRHAPHYRMDPDPLTIWEDVA